MEYTIVEYTLSQISDHIGAKLLGDPASKISNIATLQDAESGHISFLSNRKYYTYLKNTKASAVILSQKDSELCPVASLIVKDPYLSYANVAKLFYPEDAINPGIHPSAVLSRLANIDATATIAANVVIEDKVNIGPGTLIGAGTVIKRNVTIGANARIQPCVTLYQGVTIGDNVILHAGAVIGADGFGIANDQGIWKRIPQIGSVIIGDDVEIGANSTVDRGAIGDTVIGCGVKIDNQVQIGHNAHIGEHTAIAGCVGIGGSTKIGKHCMIGGGTGINGHIDIVDNVTISGGSTVAGSIRTAGVYSSVLPVAEAVLWKRLLVRFKRLDELFKSVQKMARSK